MQINVLTGLAFLAIAIQSAHAQGAPNPAQAAQRMMPDDIASAAQQAAQTLASSAKDKFLIKDLIGAPVKEPSGNTVGAVENLVVIPGGRVIAAIISTKSTNAGRIPVPFSVVKLTTGSGKPTLSLPVKISELQSMKQVQQLRSAVPGLK